MAADLLVRNAWSVAGLSHEFVAQQLQGQVIAEKPIVLGQQQMFAYPDDGYVEVFLRPDRALRRAREILTGLERAEQMPRSVAAEYTGGALPAATSPIGDDKLVARRPAPLHATRRR